MEGEAHADTSGECAYTQFEALQPTEPQIEAYEGQLKSLDWKVQFAALTSLRQLNKHHSDLFQSVIPSLLSLVISLTDSIRSNLSKNALLLTTEMFMQANSVAAQWAEALVLGLLQKTVSEKTFIRQQAAAAMRNISRNAGTPAVMQLLTSSCWHKSGAVCDNAFQYLKLVYETAQCDDVFNSAVGLLHSKRKKIEAGAAAALRALQTHPRFLTLMEALETQQRLEVEHAIAGRPAAQGSDIKSFIESRKKALQDPS